MENIIWVLDQNHQVRPHIEFEWEKRGFVLRWFETVKQICLLLKTNRNLPSLIVIVADFVKELLLPAIHAVRELVDIPILVFSTIDQPVARIQTLDFGADVYCVIPETLAEGVATGYALIRRYQMMHHQYGNQSVLNLPCDLVILFKQRRAIFKGKDMMLARREFDLLCRLVRNIDIVLEHAAIYENVWKEEFKGDSEQKQLWTSVSTLRKAFLQIDKKANYIISEKNIGYRFSIK